MEKKLLEVKNLKTVFHQSKGDLKAVNGVSYHINEGEVIAFVGESGSGKSVTQYSGLQLIPVPPGEIVEGEVLFEGKNLLKYGSDSEKMRSVRGGKIGVVFQEPMSSLNPVMTIGKQLEESIILHLKLYKQDAHERAKELLNMVGIPEPELRLKSYPHQLSGGMRQRVMIAIAMSCNPKLLIADEATTALDVTTQAQILEQLRDIVKKTGTALAIITHNLSIVARYADRVYVMYAGEIVEKGTTDDIFYAPQHPYTIGLMNAVPSLEDPKDRKLIPIDGFVTNLIHRKDECAFMNRCPYKTDECTHANTPVLHKADGSVEHFVACHRKLNADIFEQKKAESQKVRVQSKKHTSEAEKILSVENLKIYFPVKSGMFKKEKSYIKAVDDISFDVCKGETFGLVGESGCGKSTVARAILRLYKPTSGKILFENHDITNLSDRELHPYRRNMSMVFQDPYGSLDPRQRAGDIVMEPMINYHLNMTKVEMNDEVDRLFELVGLDPLYRERVPHEFSGGQRQRLAIARALATKPSFIVCDEAISALDVSIQAQVINLLEDLQEKLGLTYLFIAHDLSVVRHISDKVAVMYLGHIVEMADWKALYEKPMHPYTQVLLSAVLVPDPEVERKKTYTSIKGEIPSPLNRPEGCPFSTRCPYATEECRHITPELKKLEKGHKVACHKY